jgi:uncharacterized protein
MFLDLNKIGPEGLRFDREVPIAELEGPWGDTIAVLGVRLAGEVAKAERGFTLTSRLEATVEVACCRCLEPFRIRIDAEMDRHLVCVEAAPEGEPEPVAAVEADEDVTRFDCPAGHADLVRMVEEQVYLELPLKPVCSERCKGLCPRCGTNRNVTECGCRSESLDPRFAPLLGLRKPERD